MSLTIDIAPLYDPIRHRYKGVYSGPNGEQWDAIVTTTGGKLQRKGRFSSQEEAARAVASYYASVLGPSWPALIQSCNRMRRDWRVKKITRFLYMADSHRGPATLAYSAEVNHHGGWHKVVPIDIAVPIDTPEMWDQRCEGWKSRAMALVAIRMYRQALKS